MHATYKKFITPATHIFETEFWAIGLREKQITLGSCVLVAKKEAKRFSDLSPEALVEFGKVTQRLEDALLQSFHYDKINYLCLMMVDPHIHFHVIPRYEREREFGGEVLADKSWPAPPDTKVFKTLSADLFEKIRLELSKNSAL